MDSEQKLEILEKFYGAKDQSMEPVIQDIIMRPCEVEGVAVDPVRALITMEEFAETEQRTEEMEISEEPDYQEPQPTTLVEEQKP
jgi:hypothetical protein